MDCLEINKNNLSENHPEIAYSMYKLGNIFY